MTQNSLFDHVENNSREVSFEVALLCLGSIKGLGPKSTYKIVDFYQDNLGSFFDLQKHGLKEVLQRLSINSSESISDEIDKFRDSILDTAENEYKSYKGSGLTILRPSQIPEQMMGHPDSPLWLFLEGSVNALYQKPMIGVVGTRKPSDNGIRNTRTISRILSDYDISIVSGLAEGIDDEIHRSTLDRGIRNVAFLGHGIDKVFPQSTALTRKRILSGGGAVATEYFPRSEPQKSFFVQRNRLQALLSHLVIFVEAMEKSGTSHTLGFAQDYKKDVLGIKDEFSEIYKIIDNSGYRTFDLSKTADTKKFDGYIRNISSKFGVKSKLKDRLLRIIEGEYLIRDIKEEDLEIILDRLKILRSKIREEN